MRTDCQSTSCSQIWCSTGWSQWADGEVSDPHLELASVCSQLCRQDKPAAHLNGSSHVRGRSAVLAHDPQRAGSHCPATLQASQQSAHGRRAVWNCLAFNVTISLWQGASSTPQRRPPRQKERCSTRPRSTARRSTRARCVSGRSRPAAAPAPAQAARQVKPGSRPAALEPLGCSWSGTDNAPGVFSPCWQIAAGSSLSQVHACAGARAR